MHSIDLPLLINIYYRFHIFHNNLYLSFKIISDSTTLFNLNTNIFRSKNNQNNKILLINNTFYLHIICIYRPFTQTIFIDFKHLRLV